MINIYDWSYDIEKHIVRITFNQPLANKIISVANNCKGQLLTNIKCAENELYFGFKNTLLTNEFIKSLSEKYPNSFTLKNAWDILQAANTTVSLSCLVEANMSLLEDTIISMLNDYKIITSMTNGKISNFELNIDSSVGYLNFNIIFATQETAKNFINDYNRFKK